ncbi:MAG TPA: PIN domain-containing protein [Anaerolineae bacterium]|nr:PIN domain-containing protein [Anaerolineae bacterium]
MWRAAKLPATPPTKIPLPSTWQVQDIAEDLLRRYSLSFWDAMVIAACLAGGITRLYSEDFDAYPSIDGLEGLNPFAPSD